MKSSKIETVVPVAEVVPVVPVVPAVLEAPVVTETPEDVVLEAEPVDQAKMLRAVHGRMIDPFTHVEYDQESSVPATGSSWEQCQIDAGKLAVQVCTVD